MIEYFKLKDYKGIKELFLENLGQIHIICGKNNSGKSSILESLMNQSNKILGRELKSENVKWWEDKFTPMAKNYSNPSPTYSLPWFSKFIRTKVGTIFYEDEIPQQVNEFYENLHPNVKTFGRNLFAFDNIITAFINEIKSSFKPILIPPKRRLEVEAPIKIDQPVKPNGEGVLNRLFVLKNKHVQSHDYQTFLKISSSFSEITEGYAFNIIPTTSNKVRIDFKAKNSDSWINGFDCGLGLQDILIILCFIIDFQYNFIMIEEPESHIHPEMQRKLIKFVKSYPGKQYIFSTHSNIFLNTDYADKITYCEMTDQVKIIDQTSKANILKNLGYSIVDNLVSDLVVLTEGPYDVPIIEGICKKLGFWDNYRITCWSLGGDTMKHIDPSVFKEWSKVIALIDRDPGSTRNRKIFIENCKRNSIECCQLERYAIENYFSIRALKEVFSGKIPKTLETIDPNKPVEDQLGFSVKKNGSKIIETMDIKELEGTDLLDFCKKIGEVVK